MVRKIKNMVLVLAGGSYQWDRQEISCRETWANPLYNDPDTVFYFIRGDTAACFYEKGVTKNDEWFKHRTGMGIDQLKNAKVDIDHDTRTIKVDVPDHHSYSMFKFGLALREVYKHFEWDYLIRPNSGSYVNVNLLSKKLVDLPKEKMVYAVPVNHYGIQYGSGACFTLTADLSRKLNDNLDTLLKIGRETIYPDDAIIGHILSTPVTPASRKDVCYADIEDPAKKDTWFDPDCYHHYFMSTKDDRPHYKVHQKFCGDRSK